MADENFHLTRYKDSPVNVLAREVAKAFGGEALPAGRDGEYFEAWASVHVPACGEAPAYHLTLDRRGYGAERDKTTIGLRPAIVSGDVHEQNIAFPRAKVSGSREISAVVADISRRVVNAPGAVNALREYTKRLTELKNRRASIEDVFADVLAISPKFTASANSPVTNYEGTLYGPGFVARVRPDSVRLENLYSIPIDKARRILMILAED